MNHNPVGTAQPLEESPRFGDLAPIPTPPLASFHLPGAAVAAVAALALAMHEISSLAAGFVTAVGDHTSPGMLASPWAGSESVHWNDPLGGDLIDGLEPQVVWSRLVGLYQVLDLCFIIIYTLGLLAVVHGVQKNRGNQLDDRGRTYRARGEVKWRKWSISGGGWLVVALGFADVLENVLHLLLAIKRCPDGCVPSSWIDASVLVTRCKWGLLALFLLAGLCAAVRAGRPCLERTKLLLVATWEQRFGLLAFLPIAALSVLPLGKVLSDLFDQLPDVQRRWLDGWGDLRDFASAALVFVVVWFAILFLCRIRADWAVRREHRGEWWPNYDDPDNDSPRKLSRGFWFGGPLLLLAAAGIAIWTGGHVSKARFVAFVFLPIIVGVVSLALAKTLPALRPPQQRWRPKEGFGREVMAVGDVITAAIASLVGLGAVRAFTGPVALSWWGLLDIGGLRAVGQWVLLLAGFVAAVVAWPLTYQFLATLAHGVQASPTIAATMAPTQEPPADEQAADTSKSHSLQDSLAADTSKSHSLQDSLAARFRDSVEFRLEKQNDPVELRILLPGFDLRSSEMRGIERDTFMLGGLTWSTGIFLALCVFPQGFADALGALASATLAAGMLTAMLGFLVAYAQEHQPPELFQALRWPWRNQDRMPPRDWRLRTTPIIAMFVISTSAAAWFGGSTDVHAVKNGSDTVPARPTMNSAFAEWVNAPGACTLPYEKDDRFTVRPMLIFAAEGGGIRAAYWTAAALDRIAYPGNGDREEAPTCGRHAAFFSAGASGGAVGLAVGRFSDTPRLATELMSSPDALGAASIGLLAGDLLAFASGLRFGSPAESRTPNRQPLDRAGLMETTWEDTEGLGDLQTEFVTKDPKDATDDDGSVTGQLVLVTSQPLDGCRALLSQMHLAGPAESEDGWPACGGTIAGNDSFDLLSTYSVPEDEQPEDAGNEHCIGNVRALTAGLLASRFPYVTPSGVVGPCGALKPLQLIDGGYTDNSGLGTIVDLAPQWTKLVRDHNDQVLADKKGELVVPMVVFLENGSGADYTLTDISAEDVTKSEVKAEKAAEQTKGGQGFAWPRDLDVPEVLIPPLGYYTANNHKAQALATLELAEAEVGNSLCSGTGAACAALKESGHARIGSYVVHQTPQPSMAAPLGWVLSKASVAEMDEDLCISEDNSSNLQSKQGGATEKYGTLHDVLVALDLPAQSPCQPAE